MSNEAWEALGRRKCRACGGHKVIQLPGGLQPFGPCPNCQGTGLEMRELTEPCPLCLQAKCHDCVPCKGAHRILLSGDLLLAAGERVLTRVMSAWNLRYTKNERYSAGVTTLPVYIYSGTGGLFSPDPDRLTALLSALEALVEVER